jgi:hypothetical protein
VKWIADVSIGLEIAPTHSESCRYEFIFDSIFQNAIEVAGGDALRLRNKTLKLDAVSVFNFSVSTDLSRR